MGMKRSKKNTRIILVIFFSFYITACGKQADADSKVEPEYVVEDMTEKGTVEPIDGQKIEQPESDNVITVYITEDIEYRDEVMPIQYVDDLSLIENLKYTDGTYIYQDGKVYYRRYHEDSYEGMSSRGTYDAIPGTKKEIVCIDADGVETEIFADEGYGDIYLLNNRFYMTDGKLCEEDGHIYTEKHLYSVDMQGNDRVDYGNGRILVVDKERKIIILEMVEEKRFCYYVMKYETGEKKRILSDFDNNGIDAGAYQDGWLYYGRRIEDETTTYRLCAVSLEGEQKEIIVLASDVSWKYDYKESILQIEVDKDRVYFIFGGYGGLEQRFWGGKLISVKLDGTDYKAVETKGDAFYLCHDKGKTLIYFPRYQFSFEVDSYKEYDTLVWDMDANLCYISDLPERVLTSYDRQIGSMWQYYPEEKGALSEWSIYGDEPRTNIYAMSDDSGKIVRVVMNLENNIAKWKLEEVGMMKYKDLYYADGFLYFTLEYIVYSEKDSAYQRLYADVYRLKIGESEAQILYSY